MEANDKAGQRMTRVLAAVIRRDGEYLLCERPPHKRHGGLWEFPGGKLENGESVEDAARRELFEELGVRVTAVGETLAVIRDADSEFQIEFVQTWISGEPQALEHTALKWTAPAEAALLPLAPSDRRFLEKLLG